MYVYVCMCMCLCMCMYMYVYVYVYLYLYVNNCKGWICMYMYMCIYIYIYISTIAKVDTSDVKYILSSRLKTYNLIHYKEKKKVVQKINYILGTPSTELSEQTLTSAARSFTVRVQRLWGILVDECNEN